MISNLIITPIVVVIIISIGIIVLLSSGKLSAKFTGLPATAWQQGYKNAFFMGVILLTIIGSISLIVSVVLNRSITEVVAISYSLIAIIVFVWFFVAWFQNKQKAGNVLLDICSIPNRWVFIFNAVMGIVLGFIVNIPIVDKNYDRYILIFLGFSMSMYSLIMAMGRLQIREKGIYAYVNIIKWEKIESYEWDFSDKKIYVLKLKYKGTLPEFLRRGVIPIPFEKKEKLESLLVQYLPETALVQNRAQ